GSRRGGADPCGECGNARYRNFSKAAITGRLMARSYIISAKGERAVERTRVILADDESLIRMDLREMLTNLGYLVVGEAGDGRSAVNLARELRADIVLRDVKMHDMDSIEAARVLTEERLAPVLLLSAYSQQELVQRARQA